MAFRFKRFFTYLVLYSFFFQTIWPSVVWAEALLHEIPSHQGGVKRHSLSLGVHIDNKRMDGQPADEEVGTAGSSSFAHPKGRRIKVEFDQGLDNLRAEIQKSLDVQAFYPGLQATEKGLSWSSFGLSYLMTYQGNLVVERDISLSEADSRKESAKQPLLNLLNPHGDIVLGPDLQVEHIQANAKDVYMAGSSVIPHLEVWAQGGKILTNPSEQTTEKGQFKVPLGATLTTKLLTIHKGKTDLEGTVSLVKDGVLDAKGNEIVKTGSLNVETGVTIRNAADFQNDGPIKGKTLTLEETAFTNADRIDLDYLATSGGKFDNNSKVFLKTWDQGEGMFVNAMGSTFQVQGQSTFEAANLQNKGILALLGDSRGSMDRFATDGTLNMGSVSGLRVQSFSNTGNFEVFGPMTWSGANFKTTKSTILRGKSSLTVGLLETNGVFSALEDFTLNGNWHHLGGIATLSKAAHFDSQNVLNKGTMNLLGESRGRMETFTNEGSLTMGSVNDLYVRAFFSPGQFEVTGPMTWSGTSFKTAKTLFKEKAKITASHIETTDDLTAESDLSLNGNWTHRRGKAKVAGLFLRGASVKNDLGATVIVTGPSDIQADTLANEGAINFDGTLKGRIDHFVNRGSAILKGDVQLTGNTILNSNTFKALSIFDWVGETLTNTATGNMTLFDNRVVATRQVINQGLLLWTHNTFRTWHFLNMGWAEMTKDLNVVMPTTWKAPTDTSTTFKKSTVENRGTLKLSPKDYKPRMTIEHSGDFEHWSNKGQMQLPETHLQAQTFKNEGELAVEGKLTGRVDAFENTHKTAFQGAVHLAGKTFVSTGAMSLASNTTLKVESLTTGGIFTAESELTLEGVDWTNLEGGKTDIARLLFKGKSIGNDGNLLIRELLGSGSSKVIALLRNGQTNSPKDEKKRPLFRILKGGASFTKTTNWGALSLENGQYRFQDLTNPGIIKADAFLPEGTDPFRLQGTIHANSFCTSAFRGTKIINGGQTRFDSTSFSVKDFENDYGAVLTLFGYGTAHIDTLRNSGTISLNQRADMVVDTLKGSSGTIESSQNSLRVLLLDPGQTSQTDSLHPMLKLRKEHGGLLDMGKFKAKDDLIVEIADSINPACYLHFYADKWQCGGILRLYGDTFWAKWHETYTGAAHIKVKHFQNPCAHLIFRALKVEANRFENGLGNDEMGFIETQPDSNKPTADTSLEVIVRGDLDSRYGKMFGHGETTLRSTAGNVLVGESVEETKYLYGGIPYPYYKTNGSFVSSNRDITIEGQNVFLKLAQVKSKEGHLYLVSENNVRSLASNVFAKDGITINGVRFDQEVFSTDYIYSPQTTNSTPGNGHLKYVSKSMPQRSDAPSLRSLGNIRVNTQITRNYGGAILSSKRIIDQKGRRWKGKTTSESRREEKCPFISYESQSLPSGWTETNISDNWSRDFSSGTGCVPSIVQAGEDVNVDAPYIENSGSISSVTMKLTAVEALLQNMGEPAQAALKVLMNLGILSVRHVVEPEVTKDGLITQQPNGTVREKGTRTHSKRATPLHQLPMIGQRYLGASPHTEMYLEVSCEVEKLQQMMAFTMGRVYDQGLSGEAVYDEYVREGQRQAQMGALLDIRQNKSTKPFIAYLEEKMRDAQTEEEVLLAVMNLFVPEALRTQVRSGEARTQKRLEITTEDDLTLRGAKIRSEEDKVKAKVGGDFNAVSQVTTLGGGDTYQQSATPTIIEAPKDSVEIEVDENVNVTGIKVKAEEKIDISGKSYTDKATRLDSHSVEQHGKKKTTTHMVSHDVSEYITTGPGSTIDLTSRSAPFYAEAHKVLTGPGGKAKLSGHGVSVVDVHDETRVESIEKQKSGGPFGGSTTIKDMEHSVRSKGAEYNGILELVDLSGKTGITLVGADCSKVTKLMVDCEEGLFALRAGINAYIRFHSEEDKNAVWQSYEHEMSSSKTYTPCRFSPECEFEINSKIPVLVEQVRGQALNWLDPLRKSLEKNGGAINLQELDEIYKHDYVSQQGPTAAASLVIALAITVCTAGTMAHAGGMVAVAGGMGTSAVAASGATVFTLTTAGAFVQTMTAAALTSLTISATNCVLNNLDNPGKALQDFLKTDTLKTAMIAAAFKGLDLGVGPVFSKIAAGIAAKQKPGDIFKSVIVDQIARSLAKEIGQAKLDSFVNKAAHFGLGAGTGLALGGEKEALTRGLGALIGVTVANAMADKEELGKRAVEKAKAESLPMTKETITRLVQEDLKSTLDLSRLSTGIVAMFSGQDVNAAVAAATNAVENNCLPAIVLAVVIESEAVAVALAAGTAATLGAAILLKDQLADSAKKLKEKMSSNRMDAIPEDVGFEDEGMTQVDTKPTPLSTPMPDERRPQPLTTPIADPLPASEGFSVYDGPRTTILNADAADKQFSRGKQALVDMAKADKRTGITPADMQAYKDLNIELPDPFLERMVRGAERHPDRGPHAQNYHGHVGPVDHIPVREGAKKL